MADVREAILVRLYEIVAAIPGIRSAHRNNVDLTEEHLPAAIVFDGDETTRDATDLSMRPPHKPLLVQMLPEIVIADQADQVGSDLSAMRYELIKRVLNDAQLKDQLVRTSANGVIRYLGCQTDVGWMRSLHGALLARFLIQYAMKPEQM